VNSALFLENYLYGEDANKPFMADYNRYRDGLDIQKFQDSSYQAMAFPPVRGKMDAAESLKLMERPGGGQYYVGPGGRELTPAEVNRIMGTGVRGA